MENTFKNILNLTKIFVKENKNNLKIIDNINKKINEKSLFFWIYIFLFILIYYFSFKITNFFNNAGKPESFLNAFLLFLEILIIIRSTICSIDNFYFSKDIENILHLPIKSTEILIAKFNTILFTNYEIELLFGVTPLITFGVCTKMNTLFFTNLLLILIIFPMFSTIIISLLISFIIKLTKIYYNKNSTKKIITFILIIFLIITINFIFKYVFYNSQVDNNMIFENINNKLKKINKYFFTINPILNILLEKNLLEISFNYLKLFLINILSFFIFIKLENKLYIKLILEDKYYKRKNIIKTYNLNKKIIKNNSNISYIKKEFNLLFKNPIFLIECTYKIVLITILVCILLINLLPKLLKIIYSIDFIKYYGNPIFDIEIVCIIIGLLQIVGLFNYSSITAFSREGKNAYMIKYLPISLYKQFIYKNIPQILINVICSYIIILIIGIYVPEIEPKNIYAIFILSFLLHLINSFILTLIDLLFPKINWDSEYDILKRNKNKLLQYFLILFNILFLIYMRKMLYKYKLTNSLIIFGIVLFNIFIIINLYIYKYQNKLYRKIK